MEIFKTTTKQHIRYYCDCPQFLQNMVRNYWGQFYDMHIESSVYPFLGAYCLVLKVKR